MKYIVIWRQLGFWVLSWLLLSYILSFREGDMVFALQFSAILMGISWCYSYYLNRWLLPKYTMKYSWNFHQIFQFIFSVVVVIYSCLMVLVLLVYIGNTTFLQKLPPLGRSLPFVAIWVLFFSFLISSIRVFMDNLQIQLQKKELQKELFEGRLLLKEQELSQLHAQLHPHFLFNMLHNIYGLALKKSGQTAEAILDLSMALDYSLYGSKKERVKVKEELHQLERMIQLAQIRYGEKLRVNWRMDTSVYQIEIAPMLFLPLMENALKHGRRGDKVEIWVSAWINHHDLVFRIKNLKGDEVVGGGLGIKNLKKRLELLYPSQSSLTMIESDIDFEVELIIKYV